MTTATLAMLTPTSMMFIMFILLLMFGAKKLPELARGLGQAMKEFSKAKSDIHDEIMKDPAKHTLAACLGVICGLLFAALINKWMGRI